MEELDEKLRDIPDLGGLYQACPTGRIWSTRSRKYLKPWITENGYYQVVVRGKGLRVHRLVALAYIPNPAGKPFINHKNGVKTDNRVENLEWCTRQENAQHSIHVLGHWVNNRGTKGCNAKLTDNQVYEMRDLKNEGFSYSRLSRIFNVSPQTVVAIVKRRNWGHLPAKRASGVEG